MYASCQWGVTRHCAADTKQIRLCHPIFEVLGCLGRSRPGAQALHAAVHGQGRAGGGARERAGQVGDGRGDLVRADQPAHGLAGGQRGALLMQSSGVGNCINMFSLTQIFRFPFLTLVTMRGEWGEFNPWQVPMGSTTSGVFELSGIKVLRASHMSEVRDVVEAAAGQAYNACTPTAVLLSQRLIGAKVFVK